MGLLELTRKHGDREVVIDLLTENQSNKFSITGIDAFDRFNTFDITVDINNLKEFKRSIK